MSPFPNALAVCIRSSALPVESGHSATGEETPRLPQIRFLCIAETIASNVRSDCSATEQELFLHAPPTERCSLRVVLARNYRPRASAAAI